jgi:hypothetical protein
MVGLVVINVIRRSKKNTTLGTSIHIGLLDLLQAGHSRICRSAFVNSRPLPSLTDIQSPTRVSKFYS